MTDQVPAEVVTVLKGFCETRQSGSVTLDIKDGRVLMVRSTVALQIRSVDKTKK